MSERYSYSKVNQFENCPYCFKLRYVDKHYIMQPNLAAAFGTLVHKIYQDIAGYIMNDKPIPYDELKDYFVTADFPRRNKFDRDGDIFGTKVLSQRFRKEWYEFSTKTGKNYEAKSNDFLNNGIYRLEEYMKEHPKQEILGVEMSFEYEYRGIVFYGFIDRVLREKGTDRFIIHDIKTKDHAFSDKELPSPMQFYFYSKALRERFGDAIDIECYYDLPVASLWQRAGTKGFEARCEKKLNKILDEIEAKNFAPKPGPLCYYCVFRGRDEQPAEARDLCPYYSLWTPEDKTFAVKFPWEGEERHETMLQKLKAQHEEEAQIQQTPVRRKFDFDF